MSRLVLLFCAGVFLAATPPAAAQSAQEIMEEVVTRYEDRMEGIQDYTVTQTVMGASSTLTFQREEVDGRVVFVPVLPDSLTAGQGTGPVDPAHDVGAQQIDPTYFMRPDVAQRMTVEGTETVDGHPCWVLAVADFQGLDLARMTGGRTDFRPRSMLMFMDRDDYIPRKMEMSGTVTMGQEGHDISSTVLMLDYREVRGMLHPFRIEIQTEGLGDAMGSAMAGGGDGLPPGMRERLESMPEDQRTMVEQMMENQGMRDMLSQALGSIVVETTDVQVNTGPPAGR